MSLTEPMSETQVVLPGKRQLQLRPEFPDEQYAERTGEKAQRPEELQPGDDGHEEADGQKAQSVPQKLWLQKLSGEPGNQIEQSQPQGKRRFLKQKEDQDPREKDGSGAEDRKRVDDSGKQRPEGKARDMQEIISSGAFQRYDGHDPELGADPSLQALEDPRAGAGDRDSERKPVQQPVKTFPVSGKEKDGDQV